MSADRGIGRTFAALEYPSFRLLFLSNITSGIGGQLQQIANLWAIYVLTGSALHLGLTGLARFIPIILFSLAGGVIADRVDRRKIMMAAQLTNGTLALALGALSLTGFLDVWHIYGATFVNSTMMSVSNPARRAVIAGLVPRRHLMNALALNSSIHQMDRIIAPSLAGIMIALFGLFPTYALNGLAHLITAATLAFIILPPMAARPEGSPLRNLIEGLAFVQGRSIIFVLLISDVVAMLLGSYPPLLPIIAAHFEAGPVGFGLLSSAPAVGSLIGLVIVMYLGDFAYKGRLVMGCILAYACCLVGLGLAPVFVLALVAVAGLGLTDSMQAATRTAAIQMITPDQLRGRVSSFQHMLQGGGPALGQGIMGSAAGVAGSGAALVVGGIACIIITLGILLGRTDIRARDLSEEAERDIVDDRAAARVS